LWICGCELKPQPVTLGTFLRQCISYRFWDIQRQRMAWPWNQG